MELSHLAVPFVYGLIAFLGFPSQWLLMHLEPEPLTKNEIIATNVFLVLIFITYTKTVFVDPGTIPKDWTEPTAQDKELGKSSANGGDETVVKSRKWCRKCDAAKPPRAHHCKQCKRCVPKMDHHCPWTANCVSHTTFPHFLRFLFYTTFGLALLESFLFVRVAHLWNARSLPAYLGPSAFQLGYFFVAVVASSITLFAIGVLLIRNIWCLAVNTTTIEGWEIERHKTLIRRARHFGGYLEGADGSQVHIKKQEFPYDVGIWRNIVLGMGTANPLSWFNPLAATPDLAAGLAYPVNGFEDPSATWPPPDPDRLYRRRAGTAVNTGAFTYQDSTLSAQDTLSAFRARQAEDEVRRRKPFVQRMEQELEKEKAGQVHGWLAGNAKNGDVEIDEDAFVYGDDASEENDDEQRKYGGEGDGEEAWQNSEGERLKDFGVDEDIEFYDEQEDEIPLSELLARRQAASVPERAYS